MRSPVQRARVVVVALLLSVSLSAHAGDPESEIRALDQAWLAAIAAKDVEAIVKLYAKDGVLMPHAPPASGPEAIGKVWSEFLALPGFMLTFRPVRVEVAKAGDLAIDMGTYLLAFESGQGEVRDMGKYVVVWRKTDGAWKVLADIFNSDIPR